MFEIKVEDSGVFELLDRIHAASSDMSPLMRELSAVLLDHTEQNLADQGRPHWAPLSQVTIDKRTKEGSWPGMIMQVSGQLAASYTPGSDAVSAWIGSNKPYAAIQNLGGITSPKSAFPNKRIPARQQIPVDADGALQHEALQDILKCLNDHLTSLNG